MSIIIPSAVSGKLIEAEFVMKETSVLTWQFSVASSILLSDYFRALAYTLSAKSRVKLTTTYRGLNSTINYVFTRGVWKLEDAKNLKVEKWNKTETYEIAVYITIRIQSETERTLTCTLVSVFSFSLLIRSL